MNTNTKLFARKLLSDLFTSKDILSAFDRDCLYCTNEDMTVVPIADSDKIIPSITCGVIWHVVERDGDTIFLTVFDDDILCPSQILKKASLGIYSGFYLKNGALFKTSLFYNPFA